MAAAWAFCGSGAVSRGWRRDDFLSPGGHPDEDRLRSHRARIDPKTSPIPTSETCSAIIRLSDKARPPDLAAGATDPEKTRGIPRARRPPVEHAHPMHLAIVPVRLLVTRGCSRACAAERARTCRASAAREAMILGRVSRGSMMSST